MIDAGVKKEKAVGGIHLLKNLGVASSNEKQRPVSNVTLTLSVFGLFFFFSWKGWEQECDPRELSSKNNIQKPLKGSR